MAAKKSEPFGHFLVRLRHERGIRQRDVALAANLALSTVSKQERATDCSLRPANAARLATYLHSLRPFTPPDLELFVRFCGLPAGWRPGEWEPAATAHAVVAVPGASVASVLSAREQLQHVHQCILEEIGAVSYLPKLLALAESLGVSIYAPP
jgi:hypothetical protein